MMKTSEDTAEGYEEPIAVNLNTFCHSVMRLRQVKCPLGEEMMG